MWNYRPIVDIQPGIGASSTILIEYIQAAGLDVSTYLSAALFYGKETDTSGLRRGASVNAVDALVQSERD